MVDAGPVVQELAPPPSMVAQAQTLHDIAWNQWNRAKDGLQNMNSAAVVDATQQVGAVGIQINGTLHDAILYAEAKNPGAVAQAQARHSKAMQVEQLAFAASRASMNLTDAI